VERIRRLRQQPSSHNALVRFVLEGYNSAPCLRTMKDRSVDSETGRAVHTTLGYSEVNGSSGFEPFTAAKPRIWSKDTMLLLQKAMTKPPSAARSQCLGVSASEWLVRVRALQAYEQPGDINGLSHPLQEITAQRHCSDQEQQPARCASRLDHSQCLRPSASQWIVRVESLHHCDTTKQPQ
jgi:hypothetical protein